MNYTLIINALIVLVVLVGILYTSNPLFVMALLLLQQPQPELPPELVQYMHQPVEVEESGNPIGFVWDAE